MKTALVLAGEVVSITEELIEPNDILQIQTNGKTKSHPLIVRSIIPVPQVPSLTNPDDLQNWRGVDAEQLAFLHYDESIAKKYTQKKTSQKLEKSLAKNLGGRVTPGSGAFGFHKGDVDSALWRAEHKYTDKQFYTLTLVTWNKIKNEALDANKHPLMEIILNQSQNPLKLIVISLNDFKDLTNATEAEFVILFHMCLFEARKDVQSFKLNELKIRPHIEYVRYNFETKIPGFFINIGKTSLFALETDDFVRIFNVN